MALAAGAIGPLALLIGVALLLWPRGDIPKSRWPGSQCSGDGENGHQFDGLEARADPGQQFTMGSPLDEVGASSMRGRREVAIGRPFYLGV